ncbi:hypothetical protein CHH51_18225 [Terribacillus saccharophilus]|nr:hypothetical protein CHH51_18225 [Terribacillus saccharophilus]
MVNKDLNRRDKQTLRELMDKLRHASTVREIVQYEDQINNLLNHSSTRKLRVRKAYIKTLTCNEFKINSLKRRRLTFVAAFFRKILVVLSQYRLIVTTCYYITCLREQYSDKLIEIRKKSQKGESL